MNMETATSSIKVIHTQLMKECVLKCIVDVHMVISEDLHLQFQVNIP